MHFSDTYISENLNSDPNFDSENLTSFGHSVKRVDLFTAPFLFYKLLKRDPILSEIVEECNRRETSSTNSILKIMTALQRKLL